MCSEVFWNQRYLKSSGLAFSAIEEPMFSPYASIGTWK